MDIPGKYGDGGRIYIRLMTESDVNDKYLDWFRDVNVTEFLDAKNITRDDAIRFLNEGRSSGKWVQYAICLSENDLHIGNLKLGPINQTHKLSDLVTVIGRKEYWGKGLATEAIKLGNKLAFDVFDIRKLTGGIVAGNWGSVKCYVGAGWFIEGIHIGHHLVDAQARDRVCVSCFNPKYFNLDAVRQALPKVELDMSAK